VRRTKKLDLQNNAEMVPEKGSQCHRCYELGGTLPCTQMYAMIILQKRYTCVAQNQLYIFTN
jgi:hypothetical protein